MNEAIRKENLPFDGADQELLLQEEGRASRRPDIILWEKKKVKAALLIELKPPEYDPWGEPLDDALSKAARFRGGVPYIATWNVNRFFSWETSKSGDLFDKLWYPHVGAKEEVTRIKSLAEFDRAEQQIKDFLRDFLKEFADVYYGVKPKPPLAIDERFIFRLRSTIDALAVPVFHMFKRKYSSEKTFQKSLLRLFSEQGWTFSEVDDDFEKVARQYAYLLVDKIMFYCTLQMKYPEIRKIMIPIGITGVRFKEILQSYFERAQEKNYETIFAANFLDTVPPPDEAVELLRIFALKMGEYEFEKVGGYEVLGRVFERLIPETERHKLGQYFTRSDVVDLIVGFCVTSPDHKVLDGGVGAGTFLVRSYIRKKLLNPRKRHRELLEELYGIDIAKFPAHLSTINLATKDLGETENYPRIFNKDFFKVKPGKEESFVSPEHYTVALSKNKIKVKIPHFDVVVMNPPYTRQEEMEDILEEEKGLAYKVCIQDWIELGLSLIHISEPTRPY